MNKRTWICSLKKMDYAKIIVQWMNFKIPEILEREIELDITPEFIFTITGPRRAGKTYFCFQMMQDLLKNKIPRENLLYINFEDERLIGANTSDLDNLFEKFLELSEINKTKKIYFFFDEIQNVNDWDAWIRRIHDTHKEIKLILTGSSSKLLSKEISTKLRGRVINLEVFPLSFKEFLRWNGIKYDLKTALYSDEKITIKKQFTVYINKGGYPAVQQADTSGELVLKNYFESIIFKDIVERYGIKDVKKLKVLASLLFETTASEMSYTKMTNKLKSLGFSLSKNTAIEYISYFEDAYLFFLNLRYDYSITKQTGAIKKTYCIDNGLLNTVSFKFSEDTGRLIENIVFLELKRRKNEIYYHRENHECDFLIKEKNKITHAIQVCATISDDNRKREISGILEAMDKHKLDEGLLLTDDDEEKEMIMDGKIIKIKPVWKWLLE